jgi:hypothetical protein
MRIPTKPNAFPKGSRTAFREEPEHPRSVATLAIRFCSQIVIVMRYVSGS